MLSKDVTVFIDTVCDNNHVPCALVKVVAPTDFALTPIYRQALQKEFDIGLQLDHPYICHTVGMEQLEGLGQTIVMEYVDGDTLLSLINDGCLTAKLALKIVR